MHLQNRHVTAGDREKPRHQLNTWMHQPKCAPRSTVAVSLVGTSAAGAGSWGLRFVPRWFQRVFFCFFVFFWFSKQVHSFKGCKGCLHPDFLWEDNYVCQNGVRFPGEKDLSFYSICLRVYWWTANLKVTGDTAEILRSEYLEFVRWVGNWLHIFHEWKNAKRYWQSKTPAGYSEITSETNW